MNLTPEQQAEWSASDALIEKQQDDLARIWKQCNARGKEAVQGVMDYLATIEGQYKRLNKRIEQIEAQVRFMDRIERLESKLSALQGKVSPDE